MRARTAGQIRGILALAASGILFAACGSNSTTDTSPHLGDAKAAVLTAYHYAQQVKSVAFTGTSSVNTNGESISTSINGYAIVNRSGAEPTSAVLVESITVPGSAQKLNIHERLVAGNIFEQIPSSKRGLTTLGGARWIEYPYTQKSTDQAASSTQALAVNPTTTLQLLLGKGVSQIDTVGKTTIGGHLTTEYKAQINLAKELAQLKQSNPSSIISKSLAALNFDGPAIAKVWLDSSGRVRQLSLEIFASIAKAGNPPNLPLTIHVNADYTHYGQHFPKITAPTSAVIPLSTFEADLQAAHPTNAS